MINLAGQQLTAAAAGTAAAGPAAASAGRPLRAVRESPRRPGWHGCEDLVAWLLRANRLLGPNQRLATLTRFAESFPGGCWPGPVSTSQLSRWETATVRAGFGVIRRYEQLLGLPRGRLVAVADWAYRKAAEPAGPPVLDRGLDPADPRVGDHAGRLLDQALSPDLMTGADWDELTSYLTVLPAVFLHPATAWEALVRRLLAEELIADGPAWLSRTEALSRLMGHSRARPAIIAACGAMASDPRNQICVEPLTILEMTSDAEAARHVLRQLEHPVSDRALRGALLAAVEKLPRRHFRPAQLPGLAAIATSLLTSADDEDHRLLAAELLRRLPASRPRSVALGDHQLDPAAHAVLAEGQTARSAVADRISARIAALVTSGLPGRPFGPADPMLRRLVREMLFNPNQNRRLLAGQLIAATPYRDLAGAAVAAALAPAVSPGPLTDALIFALTSLGRPADRPAVERLILGPAADSIAVAAAWAIGHVRGRSDRRFWTRAVATHARNWRQNPNPASVSALRGLAYALGMVREDELLQAIRADADLPAAARIAASWWLDIPVHIRASATAA